MAKSSKEYKFRGIAREQEYNQNIDIRDTRSLFKKVFDFTQKPIFSKFYFGGCFAGMAIAPTMVEIFLAAGFAGYGLFKTRTQKQEFIIRPPKSSGLLDYKNLDHQNKPTPAMGVVFLGNEYTTNQEIWMGDTDARRHLLIFGTTGSGKAFENEQTFFTERGVLENRELTLDDKVLTPFGEYSDIVGIFPQGKKAFYSLEFENGETVNVSDEHLWEVYTKPSEKEINSFEEFRDNQSLKVLETYRLSDLMKNGKAFYIPFSSVKTDKDVSLHKEIKELSLWLSEVLFNPSVTQRAKEWRDLEKIVYFGSLKQRLSLAEGLYFAIQNSSHSRYLHLTGNEQGSFISFELGNLKKITNVRDVNVQKLICHLFNSLGLLSKVKHDVILDKQTIEFEKRFYQKIENITFIGEKDCQCIKLKDERGLIQLPENVISHNTEAILSFLTNALIQGSGFTLVDGKADLSTLTKVFSLCRLFRREDDLLVINYMTSGKDVFGKQSKILSNSLNPFGSGSSGGLTELMVGLMDSGGASDPMWQGRAISLVSALLMALVWLRENEGLLLDVSVIREHLTLDKIIELGGHSYGGLTTIKAAIEGYLRSIPGYEPGKPLSEQNKTVSEQHGYLQMQFTKILGSLSDTYGYIFKTNLGHVDFRDVALNRRILLVLVPALEKSGPELQNLGKIVVASLKSMMGTTLGSDMDSNVLDAILKRPTEGLSSYYIVLDEYGYYIVKDSAVMPAQARSLGFSMTFAGQDLQSFQKNNNKEEAGSIIANCNIKVCMKIEDPNETFQLFNNAAGKARIEIIAGKDRDKDSTISSYYEQHSVKYELRDRIEWLDLKNQKQGEAHILNEDQLIRMRFFYAAPPIPANLKYRLNYFIKVAPPKKAEIEAFAQRLNESYQSLMDDSLRVKNPVTRSNLQGIFDFYKVLQEVGVKNNKGALAIAHMINNHCVTPETALGFEKAALEQEFGELEDKGLFFAKTMETKSIHKVKTGQFILPNMEKSELVVDEVSKVLSFGDENVYKNQVENTQQIFLKESYPSQNIELVPDVKKTSRIVENLLKAVKGKDGHSSIEE